MPRREPRSRSRPSSEDRVRSHRGALAKRRRQKSNTGLMALVAGVVIVGGGAFAVMLKIAGEQPVPDRPPEVAEANPGAGSKAPGETPGKAAKRKGMTLEEGARSLRPTEAEALEMSMRMAWDSPFGKQQQDLVSRGFATADQAKRMVEVTARLPRNLDHAWNLIYTGRLLQLTEHGIEAAESNEASASFFLANLRGPRLSEDGAVSLVRKIVSDHERITPELEKLERMGAGR